MRLAKHFIVSSNKFNSIIQEHNNLPQALKVNFKVTALSQTG